MTAHLGWLALWGVLVGLDLACVAQTMISRPLVAGTIAGMILGDPTAGVVMGTILELFALEVLPVGAARYPDYGLGAVAAVATASGAPGILGTGIGVGVGLVIAYAGGVGVHWVRVLNGADVKRNEELLASGDARAISAVHLRGLGRDALRCVAVLAIGMLAAIAVRQLVPITLLGAYYLRIALIGAAIAAVVSGTVRLTGRRVGLQWLVLGLVCGLAGVIVL